MSVRSHLSRLLAVTLLSTGAVVALPPPAQAAGPTVTGLTIQAGYDEAYLNWDAFSALGYEKVVCFAQGTTTPAYPGCTEGSRDLADEATVTGLEPGEVYTFAVYAVDGESVGEPATQTLKAGRISLNVSRTKLTFGDKVTFSGSVTDATTGAPLVAPLVTIGALDRAGEVFIVEQIQADFDGNYKLTIDPATTYDYFAVFSGENDILGAYSPQAPRVSVTSLVILDREKKKVKLGKPIRFFVAAGPIARKEPIVVKVLSGKKWKKVASALPDKEGTALVTIKAKKKGTFTYRAERSGAAGASAGTSKTVKVKVT